MLIDYTGMTLKTDFFSIHSKLLKVGRATGRSLWRSNLGRRVATTTGHHWLVPSKSPTPVATLGQDSTTTKMVF